MIVAEHVVIRDFPCSRCGAVEAQRCVNRFGVPVLHPHPERKSLAHERTRAIIRDIRKG